MHIFIVKVHFLERFYWHRNNPSTENYLLLLPTPPPAWRLYSTSPLGCNLLHVPGGWVSWLSFITLRKSDCIYTVQCNQTIRYNEPFATRPSYFLIAIGFSRAGKAILLAKYSGDTSEKLEPTVDKFFLNQGTICNSHRYIETFC